jgi:predicted metal-dependent hydrolase
MSRYTQRSSSDHQISTASDLVIHDALLRYLELLDHEAFFEAHEALEVVWYPLRRSTHPAKDLLRGLINGAIAFEHIRRNRAHAQRKARTVIGAYERHKHLASQPSMHRALYIQACEKIETYKTQHPEVFDVLVP